MDFRLVAIFLLTAVAARAAEIKGKVTNVVGGEALGRVQVVVLENKTSAITTSTGEFDIPNLAAGSYTLRLNAVGYRLLTIPVALTAADVKEFSITLVPDNFHHTDKVEVHADPFQIDDSPATVETSITASEIRETSTVFADDPFRSIQSLPGVSAEGNNEFFAEFSVMGAPFSSVSIYMDDVLVPNPFHEIGNFSDGASLGVITSEVVDEMKLMPVAYPEKFGDGDGAALNIRTREGSRDRTLFRITAGIAASEVLGEGGLGHASKGSWLVSARRSYIDYLIHNRVSGAPDVGFYDGSTKLTYDLSATQSVNLFATAGRTNMHDSTLPVTDANGFAFGHSDFLMTRAGWRWAASPHVLVDAHAAFIREPDELQNPSHQIVSTDDYHEWSGGANLTWSWAKDEVLEAGWNSRRIAVGQSVGVYDDNGNVGSGMQYGAGWRQSGYIQQSAAAFKGRVHFLGGLRWDTLQQLDYHPISAQGSMAVRATSTTELQFAAGQYHQFPEIEQWSNFCTTPAAMPERSNHFSAAIEQRFGDNMRFRVQAFDREDAYSLAYIPGVEQSFAGECPGAAKPASNALFSLAYSRGVQFVLQRRSANRLSGWVGYTLAHAQQRQAAINNPLFACPPFCSEATPYSPSLEDQRNSLNVFATYRLRPSINLSGKFAYGSGFPISTGVFVLVGTTYQQVGSTLLHFPYQRLDIRVDKDWAFKHWKLTLYGEVLNVTNHYNSRYIYSSVIDPTTGKANVQNLQGLPVTPTAGVAFQF